MITINILVKKQVPFELVDDEFFGKITPHIFYPSHEKQKCSVICHEFSYGGKVGKLEIAGLSEYFTKDGEPTEDGIIGWLNAEEVGNAIIADYFFTKFFE